MLRIGLISIFIFFSSLIHAFDEGSFATKLGLRPMMIGRPWTFLGTHSIYANDSLARQMMTIDNVPGTISKLQILKENDFIIVQIPRGENSFLSMALVGFTEEEVRSQIPKTSFLKTLIKQLTPFPRAYGEDCQLSGTSHLAGLEEVGSLFVSGVTKSATNCLIPLLQGAWDATGGLVTGAWQGLKNLVSDPRAFWADKVEQMKNIGSFIANFETRVNEMTTTFTQLPPEVKTSMICGFAGGLGSAALLAILTGGAGAANVLLRMEAFMSKILKLEKVFAVLNGAGKLKSIPPDFFQRLSSARVGTETIDQLTIFATHKMPELITGAMACIL